MRLALALALSAFAAVASAQTMSTTPSQTRPQSKWPVKDELYVAHDFKFGTGETLPELNLHYLTLGSPHRNAAGHVDNAVLLLHGTGGERHTLLNPIFSNVLFGPGQPLDITKYFLIFPDDIGQGDSSKPSDGLKMNFPHYDYDDMVRSQHQMLLEGLHVDHLRLILGTSMGCMQSFVWGETYPGFADALMPLACLPTEIAGRNRMMRYMAIENIKRDPAWNNGNYTTEPALGLRTANEMILIMGSAPLVQQKAAPTREAAEKFVDNTLDRMDAHTDANNFIYYVDASRNYNPEAPPRPHHRPGHVHQLRRRLHQPTRARHRRKTRQADAARPVRPHPHLRPDPRPRHPHRRRPLEGPPHPAPRRIRAEAMIDPVLG